MATKQKRDIYQEITEYVIAHIEQAQENRTDLAGLWSQSDVNIFDSKNALSKRDYNGINRLILAIAMQKNGYLVNEWMTYKQAQENGTPVRKGEKATMVVFFSTFEKENENKKDKDGNNQIETIPFAKRFFVFNVSQLENFDLSNHQPKAQISEFNTIELGEKIKQSMSCTIIHGKADRAYYVPSQDKIMMPAAETFKNEASYYSVMMHELIHATAHKDRLNRNYNEQFNSARQAYALEELVAELGASFIGAQLGIIADTLDTHTSYLACWLKALKDDKKYIFKAAAAAQKAADYMLALAQSTPPQKAA